MAGGGDPARVTGARRIGFGIAWAAALALRVSDLARFTRNFDVAAFETVVAILRRGGDLYVETNRYNYSPVWAHVLYALDSVAVHAGWSFPAVVGGFLLGVDAVTAFVLARLAGGGRRGAAAALLFFANPVSVFVSSVHLQFDNLSILFLLVALLGLTRTPLSRAGAVAALSASLLVKHVTAFFPPLLVARPKRPGLRPLEALVPYLVFVAAFVPYWGSRAAVRRNVLEYRGLAEDYGSAMLTKIPGTPAWLPTAVFLAACAAAILLLRRRDIDPVRASLLLFLVVLLTIPGIAEYYFVWPIALGSLFGGAGYAVYTLTVSAFFLGSPDGLNLPIPHLPGWHGVWWSLVLWLAWEIRRLSNDAPRRLGIMTS